MIQIIKKNNSLPYLDFMKYYNNAVSAGQKNIEAISISSYNNNTAEVQSRFVNLKYINDDEWIFFSNYESPKSNDFEDHPQISALFYWQNIDTQIRIKAHISKTDQNFSDLHFDNRDRKKNALAISSKQSMKIDSYEDIKNNFLEVYNSESELMRPNYWGGFSFTPYYFEFWKGHKDRLNKRKTYTYINEEWKKNYLQP
jgi:pyridoxamine 5'-phosphate oxidase